MVDQQLSQASYLRLQWVGSLLLGHDLAGDQLTHDLVAATVDSLNLKTRTQTVRKWSRGEHKQREKNTQAKTGEQTKTVVSQTTQPITVSNKRGVSPTPVNFKTPKM